MYARAAAFSVEQLKQRKSANLGIGHILEGFGRFESLGTLFSS